MTKIKAALTIIAMASVALSSVAFAADAKTYTASGKLTKVLSTEFTIRTPVQDLIVARDARTKVVGGELKKGQSATVLYTKEAGRPIATQVTIGGSAKR
jgi:hypothetical protein